MEILVISFVFHIPSVSLMNLVRAEGAIALSTASQLISTILNIILDPIFIFTFGMGMKGAAIATAIAQFISFAILISYYVFDKSILKFSIKKIKIHKWIIMPILYVGVPLFAINLFQSISLTVANRFAATYGDTTVAALGIVISKSMEAMFAGSLFFFTYGFQAIAVVYPLCIGANKSGFIFSCARQGFIFVPVIIFMNYIWGETGVFYAQGITDLLTTTLLAVFLFFISRK